MPIVRMPDGQNVRFPDDTPDAEIGKFILKHFPAEDPVNQVSTPVADMAAARFPQQQDPQALAAANAVLSGRDGEIIPDQDLGMKRVIEREQMAAQAKRAGIEPSYRKTTPFNPAEESVDEFLQRDKAERESLKADAAIENRRKDAASYMQAADEQERALRTVSGNATDEDRAMAAEAQILRNRARLQEKPDDNWNPAYVADALLLTGPSSGVFGAIGGAIRGDDLSTPDNLLEKMAQTFIDYQNDYRKTLAERRVNPTIGGVGQSVGHSIAMMAPMAIPVFGNGISATMMYRGAQNQFMQAMRDTYESQHGKVSDESWKIKADAISDESRNAGLFEAIPEFISDKIFFGIVGGVLGAKTSAAIIKKIGMAYGLNFTNESISETATQIGQKVQSHDAMQSLGIQQGDARPNYKNPDDWVTAYKEIAPAVALQTAMMTGGGAIYANLKAKAAKKELESEQNKYEQEAINAGVALQQNDTKTAESIANISNAKSGSEAAAAAMDAVSQPIITGQDISNELTAMASSAQSREELLNQVIARTGAENVQPIPSQDIGNIQPDSGIPANAGVVLPAGNGLGANDTGNQSTAPGDIALDGGLVATGQGQESGREAAPVQPTARVESNNVKDASLQILERGVNTTAMRDENTRIAKLNEGRAKLGLDALPLLESADQLTSKYDLQEVAEKDLPDTVPKQQRMAVRTLAKAFGKRVVYLKDAGGKDLFFHGVYGGEIGADENTIYLDHATGKGVMGIVGHEITHALRTQAPDVYARLEAELAPLIDESIAKANLEKRGYGSEGKISEAFSKEGSRYREETIADMVGDKMQDPQFLLDIAAKMEKPQAMTMFKHIKMTIEKAIAALKNKPLSHQTKETLNKSHKAIVEAMAEYQRRVAPVKQQQKANSLIARIRQLGGVNIKYMKDITGESNVRNTGLVGIFSRNGLGLDDLATQLAAEGFPIDLNDATDNGGVNQLSELIRNKSDVLNYAAQEHKQTEDSERVHKDEIRTQAKELGIKTVGRKFNEVESEVIDLLKAKQNKAETEITEEQWAALDDLLVRLQQTAGDEFGSNLYAEVSAQYTDKPVSDFYSALTTKLTEAINDQERNGRGNQAGSKQDGAGVNEPQREEATLQSYTNAEVLKREAAKAKAEEDAGKEAPGKPVTADQTDLFNTQDSLLNSNREQPASESSEIVVEQPYGVNVLAKLPEFERAKEIASAAQRDTIVRVKINKAGLYENQSAVLYGAFVANGDGTASWAQATFPASKEKPADAQIMAMAGAQRQLVSDNAAKVAEHARKNKAGIAEKGIAVGMELKEPESYVEGKRGMVTFSRGKVVAIDDHGVIEVHATLPGSRYQYKFKVTADSRLFDKLPAVVKQSAQSKKLEVLKAQAKGQITGDQGAALKELADAGEHAAVDEILAPNEVKQKGREYDKNQQDLFQGKREDTRRKATTEDRVIRAAAQVPLKQTQATPGIYYVTSRLEKVGEKQLPAKITTMQDAANATAYLSKFAVEHFDMIVTDTKGKPLAVIGSFKGAATETSVYPATIAMELAKIEGAANVWASHNHPSGLAELSAQDRTMSAVIEDLLRGSGVAYRGFMVVAGGQYQSADGASGSVENGKGKTVKTPVVERVTDGDPLHNMSISSPSSAKKIVPEIAKDKVGIVFLSAQHSPVSFVPFSPSEMNPLRGSGSLMVLLNAAASTGGAAAIVANYNGLASKDQISNLAKALKGIDMNLLDAVTYEIKDGSPITTSSMEETGGITKDGPFFARKDYSEDNNDLDFTGEQAYGLDTGGQNETTQYRHTPESSRAGKVSGTGAAVSGNEGERITAYRAEGRKLSAIDFERQALGFASGSAPSGRGVYFYESKDQAESHAEKHGLRVNSYVVNTRNPYKLTINDLDKINDEGWTINEYYNWRESLRTEGHDAITIDQSAAGGQRIVIAFDHEQVTPADVKFSRKGKQPFYSQLERGIENAPDKIFTSGKQVKAWLDSNAGKLQIKKDEIYWTGIGDWLDAQGKVTKDQVLAFIDANGVQIKEVMLGSDLGNARQKARDDLRHAHANNAPEEELQRLRDIRDEAEEAYLVEQGDDSNAKFASYQLPGGENYREMLLTLPEKTTASIERAEYERWAKTKGFNPNATIAEEKYLSEVGKIAPAPRTMSAMDADRNANFQSSHFNQPNILAHIRFNERTDADGKRVLFLEEIQSDWGQKGKKNGFEATIEKEWIVRLKDGGAVYRRTTTEREARSLVEGQSELEVIEGERTVPAAVPPAPFVTDTKSWTALALKRMIAYSVDNGFDKIAWTTGEQQAARYDLSKQVDTISWAHNKDGTYNIEADTGARGEPIVKKNMSASELEDTIGKEAAQKVIDGTGKFTEKMQDATQVRGRLSNLDLKVGGEGMKGFYDAIVPQVANEILRKAGGGKVEYISFAGKLRPKNIRTLEGQRISTGLNGEQPGFTITDLLREKVTSEGLPLFARKQSSAPEETKSETSQRIIQDKMNRFAVVRDWLETKGKKLSEAADVWLQEGNMYGRISSRVQDFREQQVDSLLQETHKAGFTMTQVSDYLEMKHVPEANARMRKIHNDDTKTANGITDKKAKAALAKFEAMKDFDKLEAVAGKWRDITNQTRQILLDAGIISQDMANAWQATYENYVPLKGDDDANTTGTGKGLNVGGKQKRRLGHGEREEAIIANILRDHEKAIHLSEKNAVGLALIKMGLEADDPSLITIDKPVKRQVLRPGQAHYIVTYHGSDVEAFDNLNDARRWMDKESLRPGRDKLDFGIRKTSDAEMVVLMASPMLEENEVNVYVNGQAVRIQLNDELLARAYTNLGVDHLNNVLAAMRGFNRWLSIAYTGYNPEFILKNLARDALAGVINLTGDYGIGMTAKIYANYPKALAELAKSLNDPRKSKIVTDYRAAGGSTGAAYLSDIERISSDVMSAFNEYDGAINTYNRVYDEEVKNGTSKKYAALKASAKAGKAAAGSIPIVGHLLTLIEHTNAVTENALRLATYMTLKENGHSNAKSAQAAKMSTVNFNRKGELTNQASALYLFFNPNVQGTQRLYSVLTKSKHKGQARALVGTMILGAYLISQAMRDSDPEKWKKTPEYVRDRNIVINAGNKQVTIPIPYGYGFFWTMGNVLSDLQNGDISKRDATARMAESFFGNFSPAGDPLQEGELTPLQTMPTIGKMLLSPTNNVDSFGRELTPKKYNDAQPDSQTMYRNTKQTMYAGMAEYMNAVTGGDRYHKGVVDVSPETIKYWVNSLTGGAGKFVVDSISLGGIVGYGIAPDMKEIPIVRGFVREHGFSDTKAAYYKAMKEVKQTADEFALAKRARDGMSLMQMAEDTSPELALAKMAEAQHKALAYMSDAIMQIRNNDKLTMAEKRLQEKEMELKQEQLYNQFLKAFEEKRSKK